MRTRKMSQFMVVVVCVLFMATYAYAEQLVLKYRNVQQKSEVTMHRQSEDKSSGSGTFRSQGLTFVEDGTVATYVTQGAFSYSQKGSWHTGYVVRTWEDGSTTTHHYMGQSRKGTPPLVQEWDGTAKIVDGTGRFEGATGTSTYKGGSHANGMGVTEIETKITLAK